MKDKVIFCFLIILLIFLSVSTSVLADSTDLNSLSNAIKTHKDVSGLLKGEGKDTIYGLGRDFLNIVRYMAITWILIKLMFLFMDFKNAGEDPGTKASIKTKAVWLVLAVVFSVNFWTIFSFISKAISKFNLL